MHPYYMSIILAIVSFSSLLKISFCGTYHATSFYFLRHAISLPLLQCCVNATLTFPLTFFLSLRCGFDERL
ncbi:uncharacterized protein BDZ99DRAFT_281817 [Mytilinidion resinicola]|uniref:Uncharacterized protein n=1 Tax=Mytilinidion resinicola TaxID=574789 RepID=A0A6A6YSC2_9PEZI|nr:uncharacterized protein BDZ99DRAFT_281817 [Mytilinidion resinicola]KAF2811846.1 hypothetical protein BDZ99DRAFT_281817 [Mytilinidion resinicola]